MSIFDLLPKTKPAILAPLSGITDVAYREICMRQGCRFVYAEMTSSEALVRNNSKAFKRIRVKREHGNSGGTHSIASGESQQAETNPDLPSFFQDHGFHRNERLEIPTVAQLLGNKPSVMAEAAELCVQMGADAVDINLGCPAKRIVRGGGGSALMREPALVAEIIRTMRQRIQLPISVKIRAGWDDHCRNAVEIAHLVENEGVSAIAVHPRTRTQAFKGTANWEVITRVKEKVSIPVIGNGDVHTRADYLRMLAETGCDGVMIGRASLGAPWIFRLLEHPEEKPPTYEERIEIALEHLLLFAEQEGDHWAAIGFRKHLACYLKGMPDNRFVRERMGQMDSVRMIIDTLGEYRERLAVHCPGALR
jgi:nifR3 family TIM-barrel protein